MKKIALKDIRRAAKVLADGGTVVFPTETLYGLAASALDEHAVRKVYAIKHRPIIATSANLSGGTLGKTGTII